MSIEDCQIIDLPKIQDPRGNLTFIEGGGHIPFDI
ncbi:MAG: WxcM-like domain-containing protein, partial [Propionivibrio sp.]